MLLCGFREKNAGVTANWTRHMAGEQFFALSLSKTAQQRHFKIPVTAQKI
jgi:hypothetical protein